MMSLTENQLFGRSAGSDLQAINVLVNLNKSQQKYWVGGSRKCPVVLMFSKYCVYFDKVGGWLGSKKSKNTLT